MSYSFFRILLLSCLVASGYTAKAQKAELELSWQDFQQKKIAPGLRWYQLHSSEPFDSPQSINILRVQTRHRKLDLLYHPDSLITTGNYAQAAQALAAVNAGFFDMAQGGSVTYLKKDGRVAAKNKAQLAARNSVVLRGAFWISKQGKVRIEPPKPSSYYTRKARIDDVLFSGPLLLVNGQPLPLDSTSFTLDRHPRTCACLQSRNRLLLITVDGRHQEAAGLSLPELTDILLALQCQSAINLDGGGSTTMYIQGEATQGIVNFPSDNRTFDHYGQRRVANVIVVF